jgi:alpha-1,3-glucosyltransferase
VTLVTEFNYYSFQVIRRIFPFARGVFEDKVANFWCTFNIVVKLKTLLSISSMATVSLATTFVLSLISNIHVFLMPTVNNFLLTLVNTSIVFYLFSFQVHEKSILLAAIPVALFAGSAGRFHHGGAYGRYASIVSVWFLVISTFSMYPLLLRDGHALPLVSLSLFYIVGCSSTGFLDPVVSVLGANVGVRRSPRNRVVVLPIEKPDVRDKFIWWMFLASISGCAVLIALSVFVEPPSGLPDIHPVLMSAYSAAHFMCFAFYFHYIQLSGNTVTGVSDQKKRN